MKKLTMIIAIFALSTLTVFGQKEIRDILTKEIVLETNGFIDHKKENPEYASAYSVIELPSFYDFDLVRMDIRSVYNKYEDIKETEPWERGDDGDFSLTWTTDFSNADNYLIGITYWKEQNKILLVIVKM